MLALYTAARQNEIAQLHLADIQVVSGINVISINGDGEEKRLKTSAAKRMVPIHRELVRLGFLDHIAFLRSRNASRVFPELVARRDGYGQEVSRWFNRFLRRECRIMDRRKVFHSFRHTAIDALKQKGFAKERIAALVGHEDGSETFGRYGKEFRPSLTAELIDALPFDEVTKAIAPFAAGASPRRFGRRS